MAIWHHILENDQLHIQKLKKNAEISAKCRTINQENPIDSLSWEEPTKIQLKSVKN